MARCFYIRAWGDQGVVTHSCALPSQGATYQGSVLSGKHKYLDAFDAEKTRTLGVVL